MPVHFYGQLADRDPILALTRQHGFVMIEEAAQSHGAECKGPLVGSLSDLGCFSFYPRKNLGAYTEEGKVIMGNSTCDRTPRMLSGRGTARKYEYVTRA